jgi:hypothetical protein
MGLVVGVGLSVGVVGLLSSSNIVIAVGAVLAFSAVVGFLVPGLRYVHEPQQVDRESYLGFVAGLLRDRRDPERPLAAAAAPAGKGAVEEGQRIPGCCYCFSSL